MLGFHKRIGHLLLGVGLLLASGSAQADNFPSKPVHILAPSAAGGAVDLLARTVGQALAKSWGQQPVIDNRPGAGGIIASQALTQAARDGPTLILVASGHPLNQFIYPSVPYLRDARSHPATGWLARRRQGSERVRISGLREAGFVPARGTTDVSHRATADELRYSSNS